MKDMNQLKKMSAEELQKELQDLEKSLYSVSLKTRIGENKQVHLVKQHKKQIARVHTCINQL